MTNLVCGVENCTHNKEHLCALNEIKVGGHSAQTSEYTCCESFRNQSESTSNCAEEGCACKETKVACEATNCVHNCECECHASGIDVCGCGATNSVSTECSTFSCK